MVLRYPTPVTQLSDENYGDVTNMEEVDQGQISIVEFGANIPDRIGLFTYLRGGTAVALVSDAAAILMHVAPPQVDDAIHVDLLLAEMTRLYKVNSHLFAPGRSDLYVATLRGSNIVLDRVKGFNLVLDLDRRGPQILEYKEPGQMLEVRDPLYSLRFDDEL